MPEELDFASEEIGERQDAYAMPPGLVRLSVGAEDARDIQEDIARGLEAVARRHRAAGVRQPSPGEHASA